MFVVQQLQDEFHMASKTSVGHVVQLLYRASCFNVSVYEWLVSSGVTHTVWYMYSGPACVKLFLTCSVNHSVFVPAYLWRGL